jgi:hypothetical protein
MEFSTGVINLIYYKIADFYNKKINKNRNDVTLGINNWA